MRKAKRGREKRSLLFNTSSGKNVALRAAFHVSIWFTPVTAIIAPSWTESTESERVMDFSQGHMASKAEATQVFQAEGKWGQRDGRRKAQHRCRGLLRLILLGQTTRCMRGPRRQGGKKVGWSPIMKWFE